MIWALKDVSFEVNEGEVLGIIGRNGTGFHPELTDRENVFLNGAILGMQKREIGRKFDEILQKEEEYRQAGGKFIVPIPKPRLV